MACEYSTAIGGQRIEEYNVNDTSFYACDKEQWAANTKPGSRDWNGHLYASMTTPFLDMTIKGWLWYQGENNMGGAKGNSAAGVGCEYFCNDAKRLPWLLAFRAAAVTNCLRWLLHYLTPLDWTAGAADACHQKGLVEGWRKVWSETPVSNPSSSSANRHLILTRCSPNPHRILPGNNRPDGAVRDRHPGLLRLGGRPEHGAVSTQQSFLDQSSAESLGYLLTDCF
jgi:hypothetical protein